MPTFRPTGAHQQQVAAALLSRAHRAPQPVARSNPLLPARPARSSCALCLLRLLLRCDAPTCTQTVAHAPSR